MIWPAASWVNWTATTLTVMAVLGAGGALTTIGPWYRGLNKPSWQPPDWLFAPAWTLIGLLTVYAAVSGFAAASTSLQRAGLIGLFAVNAALNMTWSWLFFTRRRPDWALIEVCLLWLSCLSIVLALVPVSLPGAWAAVPYVAWVSFAALLNLKIVRLNPSFAAQAA